MIKGNLLVSTNNNKVLSIQSYFWEGKDDFDRENCKLFIFLSESSREKFFLRDQTRENQNELYKRYFKLTNIRIN